METLVSRKMKELAAQGFTGPPDPAKERSIMAKPRNWQYYQYDTVAGPPLTYFRLWRSVTDALDQETMSWVPVDSDYLSRYIENGEIGLDETTRSAVEAAVGFRLPD